MKQIALFLSLLCVGTAFATGDKITTSKTYVDAQTETKQEKIPAVNTNTVMTHTSVDGTIGQKAIYDSNDNYVEQMDALVTADVANAAIQTAIDTEFICVEWAPDTAHTDENCYIWDIQNPTPKRIVPDGYTLLEYIESNGAQYIDTGYALNNTTGIYMEIDDSNKHQPNTMAAYFIGTGATNTYRYYGYFLRNNNQSFWAWNGQSSSVGEGQMGLNIQTSHSHLYINYMNDRKYIYSNGINNLYVRDDLPEINVEQTKSLYLFAINHPNTQSTANYFSVGKLYKLKLSENQTIIHNYIPVRRNSDNAVGIYDTIGNQFLTNASGNGTFTAGPEIDSNIYVPSGN